MVAILGGSQRGDSDRCQSATGCSCGLAGGVLSSTVHVFHGQ